MREMLLQKLLKIIKFLKVESSLPIHSLDEHFNFIVNESVGSKILLYKTSKNFLN